MKSVYLITLLTLICACSYQTSKNRVTTNSAYFIGGIKNKDIWQEKLNFERITWYAGATMEYDLFVGELKPDSNFRKWFNTSEANFVSNCEKLYISILYAYGFNNRSVVTLTSQIEDMGYKRISIPVFSSHLTAHPTFGQRKLHTHRILGFCKLSELKPRKESVLEVPGYTSINLEL